MPHAPTYTPRYVPARTNRGWPFAGLVIALAIACIVAVTMIYQRTYKHPTDPTWHAIGGGGATKTAAH